MGKSSKKIIIIIRPSEVYAQVNVSVACGGLSNVRYANWDA